MRKETWAEETWACLRSSQESFFVLIKSSSLRLISFSLSPPPPLAQKTISMHLARSGRDESKRQKRNGAVSTVGLLRYNFGFWQPNAGSAYSCGGDRTTRNGRTWRDGSRKEIGRKKEKWASERSDQNVATEFLIHCPRLSPMWRTMGNIEA